MTDTTLIFNQIMVRKWAMWGGTYLANDLFYLIEFIDMSIENLGEENIVEMLKKDNGRNKSRLNMIGNEWKKFKRYYDNLSKDIFKAKVYYDKVEKKDFSQIKNRDMQDFLMFSRKVRLIQKEIYALALFLLSKSSIRGTTIKSEDWNVLEYSDLKKLSVSSKKPLEMEKKNENN